MIKAVLHTTYKNPVNETIRLMNDLCLQSMNKKDFVSYVQTLFYKYRLNPLALFRAIHSHILHYFTYVSDQYDETLISPYLMPKIKKGDCDDFSLYVFCVLKILGYNPNYILFGREPGQFTHIAVISHGVIIDGTNNHFNQFPQGFNYSRVIK